MRIKLTYSGDTLTVSPLVRKDKLPKILRLKESGSITYAVTMQGDIPLGTIPEGYELVRMNKYNEIVLRNPKLKPKKKRVYPQPKKAKNELFDI